MYRHFVILYSQCGRCTVYTDPIGMLTSRLKCTTNKTFCTDITQLNHDRTSLCLRSARLRRCSVEMHVNTHSGYLEVGKSVHCWWLSVPYKRLDNAYLKQTIWASFFGQSDFTLRPDLATSNKTSKIGTTRKQLYWKKARNRRHPPPPPPPISLQVATSR